MRGNTLYIVVPCYNEEEVLPETARRLGDKLRALMNAGKISPQSRVLFVNDGSGDQTWAVITRLHRDNPLLCGLDLSVPPGRPTPFSSAPPPRRSTA